MTETTAVIPQSSTSPRDALRAEVLQSKARRCEAFTLPSGKTLELRNLTLKQRRAVERDSKGDPTIALVLTVIEGTYVPGTDAQVWERQDQEALLAKECGDLVDKLFHRLAVMQSSESGDAEVAAKK